MTEWTDPAADDVATSCEFDTTKEAATIRLVETVADLEDVEPTELRPLYDCIDDLLADLFSAPPSTNAAAELEFTYQGYRIRVRQDGVARVRRLSA